MQLDFKGRVAIVTGAGGGLGRAHALALAARGARVLVNDLGGGVHGEGGSVSAAQKVVDEIRAAGGEALANGASVTDFDAVQAMVGQVIDAWGRVDVLVNNAGILRDKSFAKMEMQDFRTVVEVHLMGAAHCCKAVWPHMVAQEYGRIVMTTSSTGLYGNFGQSNYGAAKHAHDRGPDAGRGTRHAPTRSRGTGHAGAGTRDRAHAHHAVRWRRQLRGRARHDDPGHFRRHRTRRTRAARRTPDRSDCAPWRHGSRQRRRPGRAGGSEGHGSARLIGLKASARGRNFLAAARSRAAC